MKQIHRNRKRPVRGLRHLIEQAHSHISRHPSSMNCHEEAKQSTTTKLGDILYTSIYTLQGCTNTE